MSISAAATRIARTSSITNERVEATASRYPFTYAYDFVRSNAEALGMPQQPFSRRGASELLRDACKASGDDIEQTIVTLADAHLATTGQRLSVSERATRILAARSESWQSLGYPDAATALAAPGPAIGIDFTAA